LFKTNRAVILAAVICFLAVVLCAGGGRALAGPSQVIKFATVAPEGSTWIKHLKALDRDIIRTKSDGRLGLRIYAGGIVGDELNVLKKIRIGQIHCAAFSGVGFGQILPMVRVLDLPFLFRTHEETDSVHRDLKSYFAEEFRKRGFELLSWAEVGNVHLFSKRPVRKVKDLSGLKVWTWSGDPIAKETFAQMGINPIPLAITDVTTALNTGMIDTVYAPPLGALGLQWHSPMKYMTALPLVHSTGAVLISSKYFKRLSPNLQNLLRTAFPESMAALTSRLRKQNRETVRLLQNEGITVVPAPEGAALEEFFAVHERVADKLTGRVYSRELLDRVYKILKRPR
jgi:TRAP-type transport system periplasmic protein